MNLVNDPWIPVIALDGKPRMASLRDVFAQGDALADLSANPCQRIALTRLLLCVAHAALDGPADEADWRGCRDRLAPAALAYLDRWRHRFELFGEGAFLQVEGLEPNDNALADKLDFGLACGNNPTLFDHGATPQGRSPEAARMALALLVYQSFSPGGLMGTANNDGQPTSRHSEHAPCLDGSMLHAIVRQATLLGTLHANLLTRQQVACLPNAEWGHPCWEDEAMTIATLEPLATTYLGRLVPCSRAVRCGRDTGKLTLANGVPYPKLPMSREPMATVILTGTGTARHPMYLPVNPAKSPWRELASILALHQADQHGGPLQLQHVRDLHGGSFDLWTGGLAADKAKLVDMAEWSFTLPDGILDSSALLRYQNGVDDASHAGSVLRESTKRYAACLKSDPVWQDDAQRRYWGRLDAASSVLAQAAVDGCATRGNAWHSVIRAAMLAAYKQTCPCETPRQMQAYARGLAVLESWKGGARGQGD